MDDRPSRMGLGRQQVGPERLEFGGRPSPFEQHRHACSRVSLKRVSGPEKADRRLPTSLNGRGDTDALRKVRLRRTLVATSKRNKTHEYRSLRARDRFTVDVDPSHVRIERDAIGLSHSIGRNS
jgi:hypothetical protein